MVRIQPKVPVSNLFGMLEVVHGLASLRFYSGIGRVTAVKTSMSGSQSYWRAE